MNNKHFILILLFALVALSLSAQVSNDKASFGLHFGTSSGNGYSMRWMGETLGIQGTLGAYTLGNNDVKFGTYHYDDLDSTANLINVSKKGRSTYASAAVNGIVILDHFNMGRFYLMGGGSYHYNRKTLHTATYEKNQYTDSYGYSRIDYILTDDPITRSNETEHGWVVGMGPGVELGITRHFHVSFELPITYDHKDDIIMYIPQVGLYYYFK